MLLLWFMLVTLNRRFVAILVFLSSAISNWVAADERNRLGLPDSNEVDSNENMQIQALISRNRLLEQENEVLRRAAAYLSQIHIKNPK